MLPDKAPSEEVIHAPEELKKQSHISNIEKYKELYTKSVDSPDGKFFVLEKPTIVTFYN